MLAKHRALHGGLRASQHPCHVVTKTQILTLQNLSLRRVCLASTLQGSAVDEIQDNAVGQLLSILVRGVRCAEVAEVEALHNALLIMLGGAEDEISHRVDLDPSSLPKLLQN